MTQIQEGSRIRIVLEILDEDGDVVEQTLDGENAEVELGQGELPPSVEKALVGRSAGETVEVTCPAGEAFADPDPEAIVAVPREDFPEDMKLEKGELVAVLVEGDDGEAEELAAEIVEVNAEGVILDANHPLAGQAATFRVSVVEVL
ncbi:MAG: FKBP-type peptidyl-prolyl cis-trans isomerase [Planctomycetota bacterium]